MAALECKKSRKSRVWDVISTKVYLNWTIAHTKSDYRTRVRVAGLGYRSSNVETGNHLEVCGETIYLCGLTVLDKVRHKLPGCTTTDDG